jgi:tetraacyldisaccharide 4'-kinase
MPKFWRRQEIVSYLLLPCSYIYLIVVSIRKFYYKYFSVVKFPVPIIVVGNITVGGTGKTPLVIYLADLLQRHGYNPGIVTRGYGGSNKRGSRVVTVESKVAEVGDEALLISRRVKCPVVVDRDKVKAVKHLLRVYNCDIIISDDGLQHYHLPRYLEIVVVDAEFKFGNKFCLPAGPLREPLSRLNQVDFVIRNFNTHLVPAVLPGEYSMVLEPSIFRNVSNSSLVRTAEDFRGLIIHAVAGIGRPQKFFQTLRRLNLTVVGHAFPDHYMFRPVDSSFEDKTVIMTEKDAVKCDKILNENFWYLEVRAKLDDEFVKVLLDKLSKYR